MTVSPTTLERTDLRALETIRGFNLTALSAKGAVFFGLDMEGVQLQGAHLDGATFSDLLATPEGERLFLRERIETTSTHGTGCTLASAIATGLAQGMGLRESVIRARAYVRAAMLSAMTSEVAPRAAPVTGPTM